MYIFLAVVGTLITCIVYQFTLNRLLKSELEKSVKMPKVIMKKEPRISYGDTWTFYKDVGYKYRWRRTSKNQNVVGASSQGYVNKKDCVFNAIRNGYNGDKT